jgi:hypothetical protein
LPIVWQEVHSPAPRCLSILPAFSPIEVGKQIGAGPPNCSCSCPTIEVAAMPAGVDHDIYGRRPTTYGLLIGIKPSFAALGEDHEKAVNNGLSAIDKQRERLDNL